MSSELCGLRVLLGMSGGLDSTYAAQKLRNEGALVEGAVLKMHEFTDVDAARRAAQELGIPLHVIDCTKAFRETVVENFIDEYLLARTPNPCVICNREVKFKFLLEYAEENGFDRIATGHYARIVRLGEGKHERYAVARSDDLSKDQTYMLWRLSQEQLSKLVLPLGDLRKNDVREDARRLGLSSAESRDSQEICFLPDGNYAEFVEKCRGKVKRGNYINTKGEILGDHDGIIRYTVGQRKGLGIALGARAFVSAIDPVANTVTLDFEPPKSSEVIISDMVFSGMQEPQDGEKKNLLVKLRYQAKPEMATVEFLKDKTASLHFSNPQKSVTPGQSAVLYDGDIVVAGGLIRTAF